MMKRASVAVAMNKGNWEGRQTLGATQRQGGGQPSSNQQKQWMMQDSRLIRWTSDLVQAEPENLNHYRQLSDYAQRYGDLQNAIAWIQQARKLEAGKGDISLRKKNVLTLEYYIGIIEQWEKALAEDSNNHDSKKDMPMQFLPRTVSETTTESLVQRYPNEYGYRFELGCLLFEEKDYDGCPPHFQLAQRNAKVRLDAILYLGQAYLNKRFFDLAIEQFKALKSEIQVMDERKRMRYISWVLLWIHGRCWTSHRRIQTVYSADISFRDVADKINEFYSK